MGIELMTPVCRLVQGGMSLEKKMDPQTNKPKLDDKGQEIMECYMSLAIEKTNPGWPAFYSALYNQARAEFPHLFDVAGNCLHPSFAMKVQDGDGRDSNGKSVADKPGFAGHWIIKCATRFLPKCYHEGRFDPAQQIQNPTEVIKRGYYVRALLYVSGNGVKPNEPNKKPGMFLSPNLVSLVGFGPEIQGGPDAQKAFGEAGAPVYVPAGMSATPVVGATATPAGLPPLPAAAALPPLPGAAAVPALPPLPGAVAAPPVPVAHVPVFTMTAKAQGVTREAMQAQGWTDALMLEHGYAVMQ